MTKHLKGFGLLSMLLFASFANAAVLQLTTYVDVHGFGLVNGILNQGNGNESVQAMCIDYFSSTSVPSTLSGTVTALDYSSMTDRAIAFAYLGLSHPFVDAAIIAASPKTPSIDVNGIKTWQGVAWNAVNSAAPNFFATLQPGNLSTDSETLLASAISHFSSMTTAQFLAQSWAANAQNLRIFTPDEKGQQRFAVETTATPEPSTFALVGSLLVMAGLRKRFRRS